MIHDKEHMALLEEREPQCRLCPLTHASPNQGESPGDIIIVRLEKEDVI